MTVPELSTNGVTRIDPERKDTAEVTRLLKVLLGEDAGIARTY